MIYFYVDSTGWVSSVMFHSLSDCIADIRSSLALRSFSDSEYFIVYGINANGNRIIDGRIRSLYTVYRDGDICASGLEKVGSDFRMEKKVNFC